MSINKFKTDDSNEVISQPSETVSKEKKAKEIKLPSHVVELRNKVLAEADQLEKITQAISQRVQNQKHDNSRLSGMIDHILIENSIKPEEVQGLSEDGTKILLK